MKYYAVKKGRNPGIYTSWDSCLKEVKGFSGAVYKSFKTKEGAINFMEDTEKKIEVDEDTVIAYVDGSFNLPEKIYGAGVVLIKDGNEEYFKKSYSDSFYTHRNVAGEVKASELAINLAIEKGYKKIIIYHDYQGIKSWADGDWKTNNELTKSYKAFVDRKREEIQIGFVKVKGHSNDKYNDLADRLAKDACGIK